MRACVGADAHPFWSWGPGRVSASGIRALERGGAGVRWELGEADGFLALALVHHLAISGNVPFAEVVRFPAGVAPAGVVEFVEKDDPMVQRLLATRQDVFDDYTIASFARHLARHFRLVRQERSARGTRVLFHVAPRA